MECLCELFLVVFGLEVFWRFVRAMGCFVVLSSFHPVSCLKGSFFGLPRHAEKELFRFPSSS